MYTWGEYAWILCFVISIEGMRVMSKEFNTLGIDIGSTTVKIAILDSEHNLLFSDYQRHYANIRETLSSLLQDAYSKLGNLILHPMITGSGGLLYLQHYRNLPLRQMLPSSSVVRMLRLFILKVVMSNNV